MRRHTASVLMTMPLLAVGPAAADEPSVPQYASGASVFQANCAVCHRANGAGNPGLAPPLTGYPAAYAKTEQGRRQLVLTVLYGMYGDVVVDDRHYNFKMPAFPQFDDATLASVLNFVVFDVGHASPASVSLTAADIAAERSLALGGDAVRRHRVEVIEAIRQ